MKTERRKPNTAVILLAIGLPLVGLLLGGWIISTDPPPPQQPVEFFHNIHAREKHIACIFCHRTVETAGYAGMPSVQLCMSCHRAVIPEFTEVWKLRSYWELGEAIPWKKVNELPAHVYFSHKAHTVTGKMKCEPCHGRVENMENIQKTVPLTMGWCLDCHRTRHASTECWSCHR